MAGSATTGIRVKRLGTALMVLGSLEYVFRFPPAVPWGHLGPLVAVGGV